MSGVAIHLSSVRAKLAPRREPYWTTLAKGRHLGYRKIDATRGSWVARLNFEGKQIYNALGADGEGFGIDEARVLALSWYALKADGIRTDEVVTVADAARRYVDDRKASKSEACAHDTELRFRRTVYSSALGKVELAKVRAVQIKNWRDNLGLSKSTCNRTLIALKAALNLAVRERNVVATQAQEWRDVVPFKNAGKRRDLFLDLQQRRDLLAACKGALADLVEASILTGARPGELVSAKRSAFDARTGSITLDGKTGPRTIPLAPAAVTLFTRLSRSKLPNALLLCHENGHSWLKSDWDELLKAAAAKAGLPKETVLYTLRHSFITTALTSGMTTLDVARLVGTSLPMIDKHYGHLVASAARDRLAAVAFL